jgi:hypothetical protein
MTRSRPARPPRVVLPQPPRASMQERSTRARKHQASLSRWLFLTSPFSHPRFAQIPKFWWLFLLPLNTTEEGVAPRVRPIRPPGLEELPPRARGRRGHAQLRVRRAEVRGRRSTRRGEAKGAARAAGGVVRHPGRRVALTPGGCQISYMEHGPYWLPSTECVLTIARLGLPPLPGVGGWLRGGPYWLFINWIGGCVLTHNNDAVK